MTKAIGSPLRVIRIDRPVFLTSVKSFKHLEYLIYKTAFAHIEYEALNFDYYNVTTSDYERKWVGSFFVGGGFRQAFGKNGYLQLMLLYNLNHQALSPYSSPWVPRISIFF